MNSRNKYDIQDLLTDLDPVDIPVGLAESIKAEIPSDLTLPTEAPTETPAAVPTPLRRRLWMPLAASLLALVGGAYLANRILVTAPTPSATMEEATVAPQLAPSGDHLPPVETPAVQPRQPEPSIDLRQGFTSETDVTQVNDDAPNGQQQGQRSLDQADPPAVKHKKVAAPPATPAKPSPKAQTEHSRLREVQPGISLTAPRENEAKALPQSGRRVLDREAAQARPRREERVSEGAGEAASSPPASPPPPPPPPSKRPPMDLATQVATVPPIDEVQIAMPAPHPPLNPAAEGREVPKPSSTGGTAEPNDAPYGDVFFEGHGTNPFIDTEDDRLSTFGLDVDTASYSVVRRYLNEGHLPPPDAVRVEELVNYFDYGDAPPEEAEFALHAEGAPSPFATGERYYLLRFNLRGREVAAKDRPPANLTFVVDVSGSMAQDNRLGLVKRALGLLLDELRADDRISLVVYGSRGRVVLEPTNNHEVIRRTIRELRPEGATNAEEGLVLAYDLAARHRRPGAIHRVILCSDGVANVGRTSADSILERVRSEAQKGIELTTVGFGMGNYNDVMMEQLADRGNGRYAYVDSLDEAHRIFVEDLTSTLMTLAAEARSQVEFNPEVVARYRLLGYENRDIADQRFRDDTVDAGEIGVGHSVTALYEIKLRQQPARRAAGLEIATIRLRYGSVARREMVELERTVTGNDLVRRWEKASPALRLTSLVAEFAEILKGTYWAREGDLETVFRQAQKVSAEFAGDRDVAEFVSLAGRAAEYQKRQ